MKKKPLLHLCKKSVAPQLPHLLNIKFNPVLTGVYSDPVFDGGDVVIYFKVEFFTADPRVCWVIQFGVC